MNEEHDPNRTVDVPSAPPDSLDAGLAAGFGRPVEAPRSSLDASQRPVLLREAKGESDHIVKPNSDAMPEKSETGDRYQLYGEIARGGMGAVLRGRDVDLGRDLAVKVLLEKHADRPDVARRFLEEAQIGGQLQHPGVVPVYDVGHFGDRPFFTMKLVKGQTLAALLGARTDPAAERPRLLGILLQVAQALAYAHAKGVIHRDLKPANVMVGAFGEVQVMDWGLAKVLAEGGVADEEKSLRERQRPEDGTLIRTARSGPAGSGTNTEAGSLLGTPAYMPPEQANGDVALLDRRADVFGLGAILCEILTAQPPYVGRSPEEVRRKAANGDLADAHARLAGCGADAELLQLTRSCLAPEATDRPRDAQAVAEALAAYLDGVQDRLRQAELAEAEAKARVVEEAKRRRLTLVLAAVVLLALTLGGGAWLWLKADRDARQVQLTQQVNDALNRATALRERARAAPAGSAALFAQAREQAQRAQVLAENGLADAALVGQVKQMQVELDEEEKDRRLLAALDAARLVQAETVAGENRFASERAVPLFREAFAAYGLPAGQGEPAAVAARLRQRPEAVGQEVVAALEEWVQLATEPKLGLDEPHLDWLRAVETELVPDERWVQALRATLEQKTRATRRPGLEKLAREIDVEKAPVHVLTRLAALLHAVDGHASAVALLRPVRQRYPADFWVNQTLGMALQALPGKAEEAVRYLTAAVALRPDSPGARTNLGIALYAQGQLEEAIACHRKAIQLDSRYANAHNNLGAALHARGQLEEAIACFRQAIAIDPKYAAAHSNLGDTLRAKAQLEEAIACYRKAIQLDPKNAGPHNNLGIALADKGQREEAIASWRKAIELNPKDAAAHSNLGQALKDKGQLEEAIACCRKAIEIDPKLTAAHTNLGDMLYAKGQVEEAIACYRKAIETDPKLATPHNNLGSALRGKGQLEEAIACYRKAIQLDSKYATAHTNLGDALLAKGQPEEAIACFHKAIEIDPKLATAHSSLGGALHGKGQLEEAIACYRKAIEIDPKYAYAIGSLGAALLDQGRFAEARDASTRALDLLPKNDPMRARASRQVQQCAHLMQLEKRLPGLLQGKDRPASASESLEFAEICRLKRQYAAAARFFTEAFAADAKLAEGLATARRYDAACYAALAAAGRGEDAATLDEKERARLRQQALDWLRADLALRQKQLQSFWPGEANKARVALRHWQQDPDLAAVRDQAALAKLPAQERESCRKLWADVAALLKPKDTTNPKEPQQ